MRISTRKVKAKHCPNDVFVFNSKNNHWFFVDYTDFDNDENEVVLYFEKGIKNNGVIDDYELRFKPNSLITVLDNYLINDEIFYL